MLNPFKKKKVQPFIDFVKGHFGSNIVLNGLEIGENLEDDIFKNLEINMLYIIDCETPKKTEKIICVEGLPTECYNSIPSDLHFVFINKKEGYELKDILLFYLPKLVRNGIIGGNHFSGSDMQVVSFLTEFCRRSQLKLGGGGDYWWIIKN